MDREPLPDDSCQMVQIISLVILKDGEVKERFVGVQPKETIKEKITALS